MWVYGVITDFSFLFYLFLLPWAVTYSDLLQQTVTKSATTGGKNTRLVKNDPKTKCAVTSELTLQILCFPLLFNTHSLLIVSFI